MYIKIQQKGYSLYMKKDTTVLMNGYDFEAKLKEMGLGEYICHSLEEAEFNNKRKNIVVMKKLRQFPDIYLTYKRQNGDFGEFASWSEEDFAKLHIDLQATLKIAEMIYSQTEEELDSKIENNDFFLCFIPYNKSLIITNNKSEEVSNNGLLGCLVDVVEDWLEMKGITPDMISNPERDENNPAIIVGSDYDFLVNKFSETLEMDEYEEEREELE